MEKRNRVRLSLRLRELLARLRDTCGFFENCTNCPSDCGFCEESCGNGLLHQRGCVSCPTDCGICLPTFFCGNGNCGIAGPAAVAPRIAGLCGPLWRRTCVSAESCSTCPVDCGNCPGPEDSDGDGIPDTTDNCLTTSNPGQEDQDDDGLGDACDEDRDGDGVANEDNCRESQPEQQDADWMKREMPLTRMMITTASRIQSITTIRSIHPKRLR